MDDKAKIASRELGDALNAALESSVRVRDAIESLREIGYQPNLTLRLELSRTRPDDAGGEGFDMELSEEDLKTLQRMKIRFE
ncbi:MAG: hypothetical protein ABIU09_03700 [Pyrinomonadaceae bacterium]